MTEKSKRIVEALRHVGYGLAQGNVNCGNCPMQEIPIGELECGSDCPTTLMTLAADLIEAMDTKITKWISVKERLPEDTPPYCQTVNVYTVNGEVLVGFCNHDHWYVMRVEDDYCNDADEGEVTHWMPLPVPPEEEA